MTTNPEGKGSDSPGPLGRAEVVSAVLEHAADLFAARGPSATSIRTIAERAGVNHGLVFRHFGAKDNLVAAVLDHLSVQNAELTDFQLLSLDDPRMRRHWLVLARCILDGYPVGQMQNRFPVVDRMIRAARSHHSSEDGATMAVAHVIAFQLGWQLFAPFLRSATGLDDIPADRLRQAIDTEAVRIMCGDASA
ncbi:TetR/AcrR family transcriptional regulator [Nocardia cyriacigeorgica]|uniref:TetR/AcrR family transcriptional regulator n=1 Tax=Nocardia cyriacigeorgica TaxID=135487 RepID=UPI002453F821|nr:helix-turn-helix domain-containing protein [Nocardia cyriacigeorgica]